MTPVSVSVQPPLQSSALLSSAPHLSTSNKLFRFHRSHPPPAPAEASPPGARQLLLPVAQGNLGVTPGPPTLTPSLSAAPQLWLLNTPRLALTQAPTTAPMALTCAVWQLQVALLAQRRAQCSPQA